MSLRAVKRSLLTLPYTEMKSLGQEIFDRLNWGYPSPSGVCEALTSLQPEEISRELDTEEHFLARAFTKKRGGAVEILIQPVGGGWEARTKAFSAAADTVRGALSELLDQLAAYEALTK